jgi:hypothetical protein
MRNSEIASKVVSMSKSYGFTISINGSILSLSKSFSPKCEDSFTIAEMEAKSILNIVRMIGPSVIWGTDGDTLCGHVGLQMGRMVLHKSGCSMMILDEIKKRM